MMTSKAKEENTLQYDKYYFNDQINKIVSSQIRKFEEVIRYYIFFNSFFASLASVQIVLFSVFFSALSRSSVLSYSLAVIFFTLFTYFILRLYFRTGKSEKFLAIREQFIAECKHVMKYQEGVPEYHLTLANALSKFSSYMNEMEYAYYRPPEWLEVFTPAMEKFSCWSFWKDVFSMRECLLTRSIEEHIRLVKCEPTNLEVHAALANAYVLLSNLYSDPARSDYCDEERWYPPERFSEEIEWKFRQTAERAIEEFQILNDYAPDDPWVHAQLAYSYHDLNMPEQEIKEYETILRLRSGDKETLFKLGMLYFQQGHNAKGLKVYEELKRSHYKKAESLIKFYGAYTPYDTSSFEMRE